MKKQKLNWYRKCAGSACVNLSPHSYSIQLASLFVLVSLPFLLTLAGSGAFEAQLKRYTAEGLIIWNGGSMNPTVI
jgi:hypothetical protein